MAADLTRDDLARLKSLRDEAVGAAAGGAYADAILDCADALLAAAERDLDRREGLVFGPPDARGTRHAVAKDGEHYKLLQPHLRRWHWSKDIGTTRPDDDTDGSAATESEAIAAAAAHDRARRVK